MEAAEAIERGIVAAKEHDRSTAYSYFYAATQADPNNEQAWLWRASTAPRPRDALFCLAAVLAINPANPVARHGIEQISSAIAAQREMQTPGAARLAVPHLDSNGRQAGLKPAPTPQKHSSGVLVAPAESGPSPQPIEAPTGYALPESHPDPDAHHLEWQKTFRDRLHGAGRPQRFAPPEEGAPVSPAVVVTGPPLAAGAADSGAPAGDRDLAGPPPSAARPPIRASGLGKQAVQAAAWNYAAFLVSKGLLFVATLILARILSPAEFGLVSMALLVITALDILRSFGIGSALIYQQREGQAAANLAFLLSATIGVVLFVANWLLAPFVTLFFKTNSPTETATVTSLVQILGFSLLFASLGSTQDSLLQKAINYRSRMIPEVGRTLIKGLLQVALALAGFGVWSLVYGQIIGEACATLLLWRVSSWRPTREFDRTLLRPMLSYGTQIMTLGWLGWLVDDIDYLIIGRFLGDTALGLYTLAFRIPELLIRNLAQAVSTVAFPVTARMQDNKAALRDAYLTMQHYMLIILAPLGMGLFAVAPPVIHILFQAKWEPAIPVMQLLSIYMVLTAISHWPGVIYKAVGRPNILNRLALLKLVLLAPTLLWAATNYGIVGVGWGELVVRVLVILIDMWTVARFVQISMRSNLQAIWPPLVASAIMAAVVRVLLMWDPRESSLPLLVLAVIAGAATYVAAMWVLDRSTVIELLAFGRGMLGQRPRAVSAPDAR
jgi:O-antigen/teichoic acid export membrane protein